MTFEVRVENLGKLADATVRVGGLTVLAGVNNTGKSFFSKFLYSVLDTMSQNLVAWRIQGLADFTLHCLHSVEYLKLLENASDQKRATLSTLSETVRQLKDMSSALDMGDYIVGESHPDFARLAGDAVAKYGEIKSDVKAGMKDGYPRIGVEAHHERLSRDLNGIARFADWSATQIALEGVGGALAGNLSHNFQVADFSDLLKSPKEPLSAVISGFGGFAISDLTRPERFDIRVESDGIAYPVKTLQFDPGLFELRRRYSKLIYLESPTLWKLKRALKAPRRGGSPGSFDSLDRREVDGIPKYFHDLVDVLPREFSGAVPFPEVARRLTGADVIDGEIVLDDFGNLFFREGEEHFPLSSTAMGVANIGILALLIKRKILDEGTFLFLDEPESNLHPAWQVEMIRALFALARGGVNVVVATHSVDIVKYLEVHAKKHPEDKALIALNHFTPDGVSDNGGDFEDKLALIKGELTRPFHKLYMRGL